MPTNTPNFKLIKPTQEEFYDVKVPNNNMDIIDRLLKEFQDAITSGATEQELTAIREALAMHLDDNIKHISDTERNKWNGKYSKPASGIPKTDLDSALQAALSKSEKIGGELLANITVPSDTLKVDIANIGGYDYYEIFAEPLAPDGGTQNFFLRFNDDASSSYFLNNTNASTGITLGGTTVTNSGLGFTVLTISNNDASKWKMFNGMNTVASGMQQPLNVGGKWQNVTDRINKISIVHTGGLVVKAGSRIMVIGRK